MHVINQGVTRSFLDEKKNSENLNIQFFFINCCKKIVCQYLEKKRLTLQSYDKVEKN